MEKFFIVGCPRSGTTMVQQALNRHSRIVIPPETKYFFSFFGHPLRQQARHVARVNADLGIHLPIPTKPVRSADEGREFYELLARQYVARQPKKRVAFFGEKTPEHTGRLPCIRRLYPDARIVVLYRDGRDVASSLTRVPWMSPDLYVNFAVWLYYSWVVRQERRSGRPNLYFARYEDLVADPERGLAGILRFLGARYEPAVARGFGNREGIPERELAWKERALRPITPERAGAFRKELTADEIAVLERLGREALPALGYPLTTGGDRPLSPGVVLRLARGLSRLAWAPPWWAILKGMACRLAPEEVPADAALPPAWN